METKCHILRWQNIVNCILLLCGFGQIVISQGSVDTNSCLHGKSTVFKMNNVDYSVHLSKKTYFEAISFCQECHGQLARWDDVFSWLATQIQQKCPKETLSSELVWVYRNTATCSATSNTLSSKNILANCDRKHIFICKEDSQSFCLGIRNEQNGIPSNYEGRFFRLYPERKTYDEAEKYCKDKNGAFAWYTTLPRTEKMLEKIPNYKQMRGQNIWASYNKHTNKMCLSVFSNDTRRGLYKDCKERYPFICEEARNTTSCLKDRLSFQIFGENDRYQIHLSKKNCKDAKKQCSGSGRWKLADWKTSKDTVKDFLGRRCNGPALPEKIWFSDSSDCVVSLNTNPDAKKKEDGNSKNIFVCDYAIDTISCLQNKPHVFKTDKAAYHVQLSEKTYRDAKIFCQGMGGELAPWDEVSFWLSKKLKERCPNDALSSELIWVKGTHPCSATSNTLSNRKLPGICDHKHIFLCKKNK